MTGPWSEIVRLSELRSVSRRQLEPDEPARRRIARELDLLDLPSLSAEIELSPWLDGVQVLGRWSACVVQTCGVSLDPFETALSGDFQVRALPSGSPNMTEEERGDPEKELDLSSEDPPDVLETGGVDIAAYVVEHLALEIDPYPRKPGVEFEPPPAESERSPFDVLRRLKDPGEG